MTDFNINAMVETVTERIYENDPSLMDRYGEKGRAKCIEDNHHHFKHLETAYELENEEFFTDYALWLDGILQKFGMKTELLIENFSLIIDVLNEQSKKGNPRIDVYIDLLNKANRILGEKAADSH
ncbi:hypothetical protein [Fictibacillus phosphorivorans]|uniref:hypothetical protein n=1 Tax=Fictibacillus phosphorivorans TaxID=1221500 RepID=UPI00203F0B13|nr:hypothetical protein [Fictibacillus phosphorivorans]MCM3719394.1 hypothetical protein [Fictibacillus phosphorivorans]MCM3777128.1 hypothetical protein [Fictibacillus phosphorivorans]